jgi:hypothetical protein
MLKTSAVLARSRLMNLGRHHAGSAAGWYDLAMAGIVATVMLSLSLFVLLFP